MKQRVAIAMSMAQSPRLLLADEPTSALDMLVQASVLDLMKEVTQALGATVIIVTHNSSLAPIADRVIHMHDASVKDVVVNQHPQDIDSLEY